MKRYAENCRGVLGGLLAVMTLFLATGLTMPLPANAAIFSENYGCAPSKCAQWNSPEHHFVVDEYNQGNINPSSGKGVCSAIWQNLGGGSWKEYLACTATGSWAEVTLGITMDGHGQVRRYYKEYEYELWGTVGER